MSDSSCEIMIPPPPKNRVKLSECERENEDRLSDLPDCVILHILSFLNTKLAVQICILSSRYKDLWKRIPSLIFHSDDFRIRTYNIFIKFVSKVLSLRDSSISLHALDFKPKNGCLKPHILNRIVNYALSHNVQRLGLEVNGDIGHIPLSVFSCQTLTHLKLSIYLCQGYETQFPKSIHLPSLTNLQLENFVFCVGDNDCAEPFSIFNRLSSLLISNCKVLRGKTLCISSPTLVNLTVYNHFYSYYKFDLCTPSLCTFVFSGTPYQKLSANNVSSLKHVEIHAEIISFLEDPSRFLFNWLQELANMKSLKVSTNTLQVLSLSPGLLKYNLLSLGNLKSLKVVMEPLLYKIRMALCEVNLQKVKSKTKAAKFRKDFVQGLEPSSLIPDGILDFLLRNSPSAEVDFVDCSTQTLRERDL